MNYIVWEKRSISGQWSAPREIQAKNAEDAARIHCAGKGYRGNPERVMNDEWRIRVYEGARVFTHYIKVKRAK